MERYMYGGRFRLLSLGVLLLLGACAPKQESVSIKLEIDKGIDRSPYQSLLFALPTTHCFAVHVTGDHPELMLTSPSAETCTHSAGQWGLVAGLYAIGDTAELSVPVGSNRRFDLIAIDKSKVPGSLCSTKLSSELDASGSDLILKDTAGNTINKSDFVLFARGTSDIRAGENTVTLTLQTNSAQGIPYKCTSNNKVVSVTSSQADGSYPATTIIPIQVEFEDDVAISGTPSILLNSTPTARHANFSSVSGNIATFNYVVQAGDSSPAGGLNYASMSALQLNGGTILDEFGMSVDLTLADPTAANSLGPRAIFADTVDPALSITSHSSGFYAGASVTIAGSCENGASISASISGAANGTGATTCSGPTYSITITPSITGSDGNPVQIDVSATDAAGNVSNESLSGTLDATIPTSPTISINGGLSLTNNSSVTLSLSAIDADEMYITNTSGCLSGGTWENVSASKAWTLGTLNGTAMVYVMYRDLAGNTSACVSDSIDHDSVAPSLAVSNPTNSFFTNATLEIDGTCETGFMVNASATGGGTATSSVACTGGTFALTLNLTSLGSDGSAVSLSVSQIDAATNSTTQNISGTLDTTSPTTPSIVIDSGATFTNTSTLNLTLAATGASQMYITTDPSCVSGGTWETYSTSKSYGVPSLNSNNVIYVAYRDQAGNLTGCLSDSIMHDNIPAAISITSFPAIANGNVTNVPLSGSCGDSGATIEVRYTDGTDTEGIFTTSCVASTWSHNANLSTLRSTTITAEARIIDAATNVSSWSNATAVKVLSVVVTPQYPTNGNGWGKYVDNNGSTFFNASDTPCVSTGGGYHTCLHGGELFKVDVPGQSNCSGLTIADNLDAFEWICDDAGGTQASFYSVALKHDKNLSDLINFAGPSWNNNQVTVVTTVPPEPIVSNLTNWWSTPVVNIPPMAGSPVSLTTADRVYVINSPQSGRGWTVTASGVSITSAPGFTAAANAASTTLINVSGAVSYLWFEGNYNCSNYGTTKGISVASGSRFIVGRNLGVISCLTSGISLTGTGGNSFFHNVRIANSAVGLNFASPSSYNTFNKLNVFNSTNAGLSLNGTTNNVFQTVISVGNGGDGISQSNIADNNIFSNVTSGNNSFDGYYVADSDYGVLHNAVIFNNNQDGYEQFGATMDHTASNLITARNAVNGLVSDANAVDLKLTGVFGTGLNGTNCAAANANPGYSVANCTTTGTSGSTYYGTGGTSSGSDAIYRPSLDLAFSFMGPIIVNDVANPQDSNGIATYGSLQDGWVIFANPFRAWGKASTLPLATAQRGKCTTGSCQIWDFMLDVSDIYLFNRSGDGATPNTAFVAGNSCPAELDGNTGVITSNGATYTYLQSAHEVLGDRTGNENGLCESNETCVYNPHFGAYQGTGNLLSCAFQDGLINNVKMYGFSNL